MGAAAARGAGFDPKVLGEPSSDEMSAADTATTAEVFVDTGVDLVLFVGDGSTVADVAEALDGIDVSMLGVPAGVRVYSSVFAVSFENVVRVVTSFERAEARKVMDIDEDDYRDGEARPELRMVAHVSVAEDLQSSK